MPFRVIEAATPLYDETTDNCGLELNHDGGASAELGSPRDISPRDLTQCFQRLAAFDNGLFERLGRYETALWRQTVQIIFLLQSAKRR